MKTMNDNDIDKLIAESLKREAILDDINRQVMKSVGAESRKRRWQAWGKSAAHMLRLAAHRACTHGVDGALCQPGIQSLVHRSPATRHGRLRAARHLAHQQPDERFFSETSVMF